MKFTEGEGEKNTEDLLQTCLNKQKPNKDLLTPKQGPDRARGARPHQAAISQNTPEHREPPTHQRMGAPATDRECGGEIVSILIVY